jgi:hypothetical protein
VTAEKLSCCMKSLVNPGVQLCLCDARGGSGARRAAACRE